MLLAKKLPGIASGCVSPGFINTKLTAGWGASMSPEQGNNVYSIQHCLFAELVGNG